MTQNSNLSLTNFQPESNLLDKSSCKSVNKSKIANNTCLKLGISISLAAAIHLPNFNQAAQATDLTNFQVQSLSPTRNDGFGSIGRQNKIASFLPRILSLIPFSAKSRATNLANDLRELRTDAVVASAPQQINRVNIVANRQKSDLVTDTEAEYSVSLATAKYSSVKSPQRIHQVQRGDTINKIAKKYQVSREELIKLNQIKNSNIIFVDQRLKLPATATDNQTNHQINNQINNQDDPYIAKLRADIELLRAQSQKQKSAISKSSTSASLLSKSNSEEKYQLESDAKKSSKSPGAIPKLDSPEPRYNLQPNLLEENAVALNLPPLPDSDEYLPSAFDGYMWPAKGVLTSGYGWRWGRMHRGIDIAAPVGTPIVAAASGEVISAGWHSGYGNLVKLEHLDGSVTLYAHNHRNLVSHGQKVNQGEQIAEMGSTGYSTGSHLHFEVHSKNQEVLDPLALLN